MRRKPIAVLVAIGAATAVATSVAQAQSIMNPARIKNLVPRLDPAPGDRPIHCEVTALKPSLNFSFRFQAGYTVRVPINQYQGSGHTLAVLASITPEGRQQPVYLGNHLMLPD